MSRPNICNGWYIGYEGQLMPIHIILMFLSRFQLLALILLLWSTYQIFPKSHYRRIFSHGRNHFHAFCK